MRMVVTGRSGQVVRSLIERAGAEYDVVALGRPQLDLTDARKAIIDAIRQAEPDVIISAAAYTQVDKAQSEPDLAFAVNEVGVRGVAAAARELDVPLVHLSTDYVFDGKKPEPYVEDDPTNPQTIYGASKLAGERAVLEEHSNTAVLRTAWVYSPFGTNFVKTMLRLSQQRKQISVVSDQQGNPTSASDIAAGAIKVASNLMASDHGGLRGVFHMAGSGEATWASFAETIFATSAECGGPSAAVLPIATSQYPTPAMRPANSRLNTNKLAGLHDVRFPEWRHSVRQVVKRLLSEGDLKR